MQKLLEHYGSIWEIRPYGQAHRDCSTFLHFGYSQSPMGAHGGPIRVRDGQKRGFWAAPPGCGMARNGVSGRRAPGCQMARNPEFSGFLAIPHPETLLFRRKIGSSKMNCFIFGKFLKVFFEFLPIPAQPRIQRASPGSKPRWNGSQVPVHACTRARRSQNGAAAEGGRPIYTARSCTSIIGAFNALTCSPFKSGC